MRTIWKFPLPVKLETGVMTWNPAFKLEMPFGAEILSVQMQHEHPVVWACVDPEAEKVERRFILAATGKPFPEPDQPGHERFIGTFQMGGGALILHLFEWAEAPSF